MEQARDKGAVVVSFVARLRASSARPYGEHDAEAPTPGGEDHPVDGLPVEDAQAGLAGLPRNRDANCPDPEVARVAERALGGRLVRPLEGVVGDTDEQAGRSMGRARQQAGERHTGAQSPSGASHTVFIGAGALGRESVRA